MREHINIVSQLFIAVQDSGCQVQIQANFRCARTPKYRTADKHNTHVHPVILY